MEPDHAALDPMFFGRQREMDWLLDRSRGRGTPIVITGVGGVGKTALLKKFLGTVRTSRPPLSWTPSYAPGETMTEISVRIEELYRDRNVPEIVAIDDADMLSDEELNTITGRLLNLKAIETLIFVSRRRPDIARADILEVRPLGAADAQEMVRSLLGGAYHSSALLGTVAAAGGLPLAIMLLANLARGKSSQEVAKLLRGEIYNLSQRIILPERKLITEVKPRIIMANEALVERLRSRPQSIYDLPPRKFEELVAELLTDLGYEVELTPPTRDGGKDILAYMTTPHGKLLCLVEAKRYRQDRTVGVELVRQLYGTLIDADASSAMMVTTSSFSSDARSFQQRHQYKLALRDYGNLLQWIGGYRRH
ncbi:MAG TPA: restriction endonuclease [Allosphingosinicella sp.]|nr:restriction endonuclease [Allosphingosinicella sp.]